MQAQCHPLQVQAVSHVFMKEPQQCLVRGYMQDLIAPLPTLFNSRSDFCSKAFSLGAD